jgi:hypothetical protein
VFQKHKLVPLGGEGWKRQNEPDQAASGAA